MRWTVVALFIAIGVVSGACSKSDDKSAARARRPPPLVVAQFVIARDLPVEVRGPVDLRPIAQADVGSKTLGYLDAVLVDRGDRVKKGQLLAVIRPSDLPDQLAAARNQYSQTRAATLLAQANLERAKKLAPEGVVSQQELQQALTAGASAEAAEAAAKAQIGATATRYGETRIESPLDGVVLQRKLDPGALVGPATGTVLLVGRTDVMRVFIAVNERDAVGVALGQAAQVVVDALPDKPFEGSVVRFAPAFDPLTRTLDAEVHLPNKDDLLRPGMYGRGTIRVGVHKNATVLPVSAVQINENANYAYVVTEGNKVERRKIELGIDGGDWLEVTKGIKPGEKVVTTGIEGLTHGTVVRIDESQMAPLPSVAREGAMQ